VSSTAALTYVPPLFESPVVYERSRGRSVSQWAEEHLLVLRGPRAGQPLSLLTWERYLLARLLETRDDDLLRYRRALVGIGRQNGKSIVGGLLATESLMRGPQGSQIYSAAGDRYQARIVFGEAKRQVETSPLLSRALRTYRDAIENPTTGSVYRVLSSEAKLSQGFSPYLVIFDEVHVQPNEDLWDALSLGMGALDEALILGITTAGSDPDSLCGRLYSYGKRVASGEVDDAAFGFWWWEAHEDMPDVHDETAWREANPSYAEGLMSRDDFVASANNQRPNSFRRYRLNKWVRIETEGWVDSAIWQSAQAVDYELADGATVVAGFDGSVDSDATALVCVDVEHETAFVHRVWEPDLTNPDWQVPRDEVNAAVDELFERYDVRAFGADPAWWRSELQAWADRYGDVVVEWPVTNARMAPSCSAAYARLRSGALWHDGDPLLARHVQNAVVKDLGAAGVTIRKERRHSTRYIDAAVALVIAVDMLERYGLEAPKAPGQFYSF
jgi:phage terminase large subunit-like protein